MGLFLRKSFKAGPVRINLSKSGLGASVGVKGLRVGKSANGRSYVNAGRGGLYYRKSISAGKSPSSDSMESVYAVLVIILIALGVWGINWLFQNPETAFSIIYISIFISSIYLINKVKKSHLIKKYKYILDKTFVLSDKAPDKEVMDGINKIKNHINKYKGIKNNINLIEKNIYGAVLDKIIDDQYISDEEHKLIESLENIVSLSDEFKIDSKIDIFQLLYLDIISDHEVSGEEIEKIKNYQSCLELNDSHIENELEILREFIRAQELSLPLSLIETDIQNLQKKEIPYYLSKAKVLSRKKAKRVSGADYEYSIRREGKFIVTDKRILVINDGVSSVKLNDILDIDIDLDNSMLVITKDNATVPVYIQTDEPIYSAKIIDLLYGA